MQKTVLTGLFACTLVFLSQSATASAASLDQIQTKQVESPAGQLVALANEVSTIEELLEEENSSQEAVEVAETEQKETVIEHTVVKGESLSKIASQHNTTWQRLFYKNASIANPNIISEGDVIVVPTADEQLEERELPKPPAPAPAPARQSSSTTRSTVASAPVVPRGSSGGNLYAPGNCTWYVKSLRPDLPNNLGNALTWTTRAAAQGLPTGSTPRVGAVANRNNHVAYVTAVNGDGTIDITDMNYRSLYAVTHRTVPANQWTYIY